GSHAAERPGCAADPHVDERRRLAVELETCRKLLQLQRHAQSALDRLFASDDRPQEHRQPERQHLEAEVAERPHSLHVYCTWRLRGTRDGRCSSRRRRRVLSASGLRPRSICPSATIEMFPVSSDTTIATESFSSVSPMAARCREPSSLLSFGLTVS